MMRRTNLRLYAYCLSSPPLFYSPTTSKIRQVQFRAEITAWFKYHRGIRTDEITAGGVENRGRRDRQDKRSGHPGTATHRAARLGEASRSRVAGGTRKVNAI